MLSEMRDFEYKEPDSRSLALRYFLYPQSSPYAWESGGLPQSIESLTRQEVVDYHKEYYRYSNTTLFLVGAYDRYPADIFRVLDGLDSEISASLPPLKKPMDPIKITPAGRRRNDVSFPSEKAKTGSMAFAWEGPPLEDVETHIALDLLTKFLQDDPASPLRQRFTNRSVPIAGNIECFIRPYVPSALEINFTEVPFNSYISHAAQAAANTNRSRSSSKNTSTGSSSSSTYSGSSSYPSPSEAFGPLDLSRLHDDVDGLFAPNYYRKQLSKTLAYIVEHWLADNWRQFNSFISKQNSVTATKFSNLAIDERDYRGVLYMLTRDFIVHRLSPDSIDNRHPNFASHGRAFTIRKSLEQRDCGYWRKLVQRWFIDNTQVHLAMIPDSRMSTQIEAERNLAQRNRVESMTPKRLEEIRHKLEEAMRLTKVNVPREAFDALPPVPDISKVQMPTFGGHSFLLADKPMFSSSPFGNGRVLTVPDDSESKINVELPLAGLSTHLKPYIPLFVSLMSAKVGMTVPKALCEHILGDVEGGGLLRDIRELLADGDMEMAYIESSQMESALNKTFTEYTACIGEYLTLQLMGHWPNESLTLYGSMPHTDYLLAARLLILKLLFGDFNTDVLLKTASDMYKRHCQVKGTGASLLIDTFPWLRYPGTPDACTFAKIHNKGTPSSEDEDRHRDHPQPLIAVDGMLDINARLSSTTAATTATATAAVAATTTTAAANESYGRVLNLYYQIPFLSQVVKMITNTADGTTGILDGGTINTVSRAIYSIRSHFVSSLVGTGLVHITLPTPVENTEAQGMVSVVIDEWLRCAKSWKEINSSKVNVVTYPASPCEIVTHSDNRQASVQVATPPRKRQKLLNDIRPMAILKDPRDHPSSRVGSQDMVRLPFSVGVHMALSQLQTSYVGMQVQLKLSSNPDTSLGIPIADQLRTTPAIDCFSLSILCHILNRSEGLVKNAIRGPGYAYGVGIHCRGDDGFLAVYVSHAVNPYKATEAFWQVLEKLAKQEEWDKSINEFELNAARSIFLLRKYSSLSRELAAEDAAAIMTGFTGLEQRMEWIRSHIKSITLADLRRVFLGYFMQFISKPSRSMYVVATPQYMPEIGREFLEKMDSNPYGIQFQDIEFTDLDL